jgi:hypothetical protein
MTRVPGLGGAEVYQLEQRGDELIALTDSGLYKTSTAIEAWRPFGPVARLSGFAITDSGFFAIGQEPYSVESGYRTRRFRSRNGGASWQIDSVDGRAELLAAHRDSLVVDTREIGSGSHWLNLSHDGWKTWEYRFIDGTTDLLACDLLAGTVVCASREGIAKTAALSNPYPPEVTGIPAYSALGDGKHLFVLDTLGTLHCLDASREVWSVPAERGILFLAGDSGIAIARADNSGILYAEGKPAQWKTFTVPQGIVRFFRPGPWHAGQGWLPTNYSGVYHVDVRQGRWDAKPFNIGLDRLPVFRVAPMANRLYAHTIGGVWRLDPSGTFKPFLRDPYGAYSVWTDGIWHISSSYAFPELPLRISGDDGKTWTELPLRGIQVGSIGKLGDTYLISGDSGYTVRETVHDPGTGADSVIEKPVYLNNLYASPNPAAGWTRLRSSPRVGFGLEVGDRALFRWTADSLYRSIDTGRTWISIPLPVRSIEHVFVSGATAAVSAD